MGNDWPFKEGSDNWPFSETENWPFDTEEDFPFGDSEDFPFHAAAGAAPIAGITAWLKLDNESVGAISSIVNPGSAGGNWIPTGSLDKSVVADGPNGMKYANNPHTTGNARTEVGSLVLNGKTLEDLFAADAGMIGVIAKVGLAYSDTVNQSPHIWEGSQHQTQVHLGTNIFVCGHHASLGWIRPTIDNSSKNLASYTTDTWRTIVLRWDGTEGEARMNGAAWSGGGDGNVSNLAYYLHLLANGGGSTLAAQAIAECIVSTESSQATAETLETYLIGRAGL